MLPQLLKMGTREIVVLVFDLFVVTVLIYRVLALFAGTRAMSVVNGFITLIVVLLLARQFGLSTLYWFLQKGLTAMFVALPIVFQPELRRALERLGTHRAINRWLPWLKTHDDRTPAEYVTEAAATLQNQRVGGLLVIRGQMSLTEIIETGIPLDASISTELLCQIFVPNSPLHDGAAVVSGNRIISAACLLPLSGNDQIAKDLGTRHRAALGLAEVSDATVVVVSEETGRISLARDGQMMPMKNVAELKLYLEGRPTRSDRGLFSWIQKRVVPGGDSQ